MKRQITLLLLVISVMLLLPLILHAAEVTVPSVSLGLKEAKDPKDVVGAIQILFILTILALAPSIMIMVTAFTRIIVVFGFLRFHNVS